MNKVSHFPKILINYLILFVMLIVLLYPTGLAKATSFTVGTFSELDSAISSANGNSEADTITLTADITLSAALTQITSEITIDGAGYTLSGGGSYRVLDISSSGNLTLNSITISSGYVSDANGGGIYNSGTLEINYSTISNNSAVRSSTAVSGGGLYNTGTVTINYSTFSGNSTVGSGGQGGGLINNGVGTVTINHSTFSGNSSGAGGGARNNNSMTINNSTFSGNSATFGGGIVNNSGDTLTVNNSTFSGNSASSNYGGGIRNDGTLHYSNTIIANSTTGGDCSNTGTISTYSYNLVEDGSCSATYSGDPSLDALADNGGPTMTHALQSGSSAIDIVPNDAAPNDIDQRGAARDFDGDSSPSSNEGDIGAYEFRESITQGTCSSGSPLAGTQTFAFASGRTVTIDINSNTDLDCITVEEMESAHPLGNQGIRLTNNWWLITGDGSTFNVNITLPASFVPDSGDQVCRYTGPGTTWDCSADSFDSSTITRNNVTAFSNWATFEDEAPTALSLSSLSSQSNIPVIGAISMISFTLLLVLITLRQLKQKI